MRDKDYSLQSVEFDPFAGPEIEHIVPAIEPQMEIWASYQIGGEDANRSYNESVSLSINGSLDYPAMEKSIRDLVDRHESLRAGFSPDGKQLFIFKNLTPEYSFQDISSLPDSDQKLAIDNFLLADANRSFDLINGPLIRIHLFKSADNAHHLTISAHHIICDGWSMAVILQDLSKLYTANHKGLAPDLPAAPLFSAYTARMRSLQETPEYQKTENYWLNQYAGEVPVLDIPTDYSRPEVRTYKSRRDDYELRPDLIAALKKLGAQAGSSFVSTMIVAFEIFLSKISGQTDIIVGVPAAGQSTDDNAGLVGHCVNMLPIRSLIDPARKFIDVLKERKGGILDAYDNQQYTFGTLLQKTEISRDASRVPLIPVIFNVDIGMDEGVHFEGLTHELFINKREFENFEIFLNASGTTEQLTLEWSYNTALFKADTINRMMGDFESLIEAVVADPGIHVGNIRLERSTQFQKDVYTLLNDTKSDYPAKPIHQLIATVADQHPDNLALKFGNDQYTYRQLNESANKLAGLLISEGIGSGDTVAMAVDRSSELLISLLAILKTGAAYLPVDPGYPAKRIEFMLSDSAARFILVSPDHSGKFGTGLKEIVISDLSVLTAQQSSSNPDVIVSPDSPAYIIYTSGSTGQPKGTVLKHGGLTNVLWSLREAPGVKAHDCMLAIATISFDIAAVELFLPLIVGAQVLIATTETAKDGTLLYDLLRTEHITIMQATPSTWRMLIDAGFNEKKDLKIFCGGEALSRELAAQLLYLGRETWNMYGPTETTIYSIINKLGSAETSNIIGRPVANTSVYILDNELNYSPPGVAGEICIAGDGLALGYINQPELTDLKFPAHPFSCYPDSRIYRTGDLGKLDESGNIVYLGRIDNQVKIRGHRIELDAIEHSITLLPEVKQAVVHVREDKIGDQRLVAYIVPQNYDQYVRDASADADYITLSREESLIFKQAVQDLLPSFMVPSEYVATRKIPLLPNGKINRNALPKPEAKTISLSQQRLPVTPLQKLVGKVWEDILGVETVTLDDDFFELGGHSLLAVQLITRLENETGKRVPFTSLFRVSSLEEFADLFLNDK